MARNASTSTRPGGPGAAGGSSHGPARRDQARARRRLEERAGPRRGHRIAVKMALALLATAVLQLRQLLGIVDPLGGNGEPKALAEPDQRADDRRAVLRCAHALDEASVDLDLVELEVAQVVKTRIAGAEVVERHPYAGFPQSAQYMLCALEILHQRTLGDRDLQTLRRQLVLRQNPQHARFQVAVLQLTWIECERQGDMRRPARRHRAAFAHQ